MDLRTARINKSLNRDYFAELPDGTSTDMRKSVSHNAADGNVTLQGNSRVYLHVADRTLAALEYCFHQGWAEDVVLDEVHRPVLAIKQYRAEQKAAAQGKAKAAAGEAPEVVMEAVESAAPERKAARTGSGAGRGRGRGGARAAGSRGRTARTVRGVHPYMNKTITLMGNAVNLPDLSAVLIPPIYASSAESGLFEYPPDFDDLELLDTDKVFIFTPNLDRLDEECDKWTKFHDQFAAADHDDNPLADSDAD